MRAETFTEHVVSAIRASEMGIFRQSYRNADVLLLDDVHILSRKGATQEELFHTFNALHLEGKQIILASKCPPNELQEIEPRLVSRFEWALYSPESAHGATIEPILKAKAKALQYPLSPKISEYPIDGSPKAAIRALKPSSCARMFSKAAYIVFRPMSVQLAKHYLSDLLLAEKQTPLPPIGSFSPARSITASVPKTFSAKPSPATAPSRARLRCTPAVLTLNSLHQNQGEIFGRDHQLHVERQARAKIGG